MDVDLGESNSQSELKLLVQKNQERLEKRLENLEDSLRRVERMLEMRALAPPAAAAAPSPAPSSDDHVASVTSRQIKNACESEGFIPDRPPPDQVKRILSRLVDGSPVSPKAEEALERKIKNWLRENRSSRNKRINKLIKAHYWPDAGQLGLSSLQHVEDELRILRSKGTADMLASTRTVTIIASQFWGGAQRSEVEYVWVQQRIVAFLEVKGRAIYSKDAPPAVEDDDDDDGDDLGTTLVDSLRPASPDDGRNTSFIEED